MIIDASVIVDVVADGGARGEAADEALSRLPASEPLVAPGHFAFELMSGLNAVARRPGHDFSGREIEAAIAHAEGLGIEIEPIPWADVTRAWKLSGSLRFSDALYVAAAERRGTGLLTSDRRISRSGARFTCPVVTVPVA